MHHGWERKFLSSTRKDEVKYTYRYVHAVDDHVRGQADLDAVGDLKTAERLRILPPSLNVCVNFLDLFAAEIEGSNHNKSAHNFNLLKLTFHFLLVTLANLFGLYLDHSFQFRTSIFDTFFSILKVFQSQNLPLNFHNLAFLLGLGIHIYIGIANGCSGDLLEVL